MSDIEHLWQREKKKLYQEINNILNTYKDTSYSNALELNRELQRRLSIVRQRLFALLNEMHVRFKRNEETLTLQGTKKKTNNTYMYRGMFFCKGNMYFRDMNGRPAPNTPDYEFRVVAHDEMFPMDFNLLPRHTWSVQNKATVVKAIKQQLMEHLKLLPQCRIKSQIALHDTNLASLLRLVGDKFEIDFHQICSIQLSKRHHPSSCEAMWNCYLHPKLLRTPWTDSENARLLASVKEHKYQNWEAIAADVGRRSDYQCFVHFNTSLKHLLNKRDKWTPADDKRLLHVISKCENNGIINWTDVVNYFPNKPKSSVFCRYYYSLTPNKKNGQFSAEEDVVLLAAYDEYKGNFALIPRSLFPNRTVCQLRAHYFNTLMQRHKHKPWTPQDDAKLIDFVNKNGTTSWAQCAEQPDFNHSRTSCRVRYYTIQRFLKKYPNATLSDVPHRYKCTSDNVITQKNWTEKLSEMQGRTKKKLEIVNCDKGKKFQSFIKRLRPLQLKHYNFFKYSYNLRLDRNIIDSVPRDNFSLARTARSLHYRVQQSAHNYVLDYILPWSVRMDYADMLYNLPNQEFNFKALPPNWSTLMAFRALCIQASQKRKKPIPTTTKKIQIIEIKQEAEDDDDDDADNDDGNDDGNDDDEEDEIINYNIKHPALVLFRKRFHALFYITTLLSRLNPNTLENIAPALKTACTNTLTPLDEHEKEPENENWNNVTVPLVKRCKLETITSAAEPETKAESVIIPNSFMGFNVKSELTDFV